MPKITKHGGPSYPIGMVPSSGSGSSAVVDSAGGSDRPNVSDNKAAWVAYAESVGVDPDGLTKDQIIEKVGDG